MNPLLIYPDPCEFPEMASVPLVELKKHLMLYVPTPPGPKTSRKILDAYWDFFGDPFKEYQPTDTLREERTWDAATKKRFLSSELPRLRQGAEWGYSFWDGLNVGSRSIMFHGYTPVREPGLASFWRFEFDWQLDECLLRDFLVEVFGLTLCVTGYGGYTFVGLPSGEGAAESWDVIYAWARRYWGINVEDVDVSAAALLDGMKCVSWLTAIGPGLCLEHPHAVKAGRAAASWSAQTTSGTILQVGETPVLGDRNRQDDLSQYEAMANALLPLQVQQHGSFGEEYDCKWDERSTMAWLKRFTNPSDFSSMP